MNPLIDSELEKLDRRHAQLTKLDAQLAEAFDLYNSLIREMPAMPNMAMPGYHYPPGGLPPPGAVKYPFPQPQAPPQSPPMPAYAPPGAPGVYMPNNQPPNPAMPYPNYVNPFPGHQPPPSF